MPAPQTPRELAITFTEAWSDHDMDAAAGYLAEDVLFDGPGGYSDGKTAYLEGLTPFARDVTGMTVLGAFGDGDRAIIMYEVSTGSRGTLTCAELLTFRGGKIQADRLTFSAAKSSRPTVSPPAVS